MTRLKHMLGVTLLEIMLVLAIAAMIIVMSIRYYQSATSSSQVNYALQQVQAISAAADNLAQTSGSYQTGLAGGGGALAPLLPANGLVFPWGETVSVQATGASTYTISFSNIPSGVCPLLRAKLLANNHYSAISGGCAPSGGSAMTFQYNASP